MLGKLDADFRFHETALRLRSERQQILASNIANADTPNYKAKDIDFQGALAAAMSQQDRLNLDKTSPAHLGAKQVTETTINGTPLLYRKPLQASIDGNTVDMDVERTQFAENAIRYEAGLTMISSKIKAMLAAVQG